MSESIIIGGALLLCGIGDLAMAVYFLRFRDTSQLDEKQKAANKAIAACLSVVGLLFSALGCALVSGATTLQGLLAHLGG